MICLGQLLPRDEKAEINTMLLWLFRWEKSASFTANLSVQAIRYYLHEVCTCTCCLEHLCVCVHVNMISHSFACKRGQEREIKEETHCRNLQAQELRESENRCVRVWERKCASEWVCVWVRAPFFLFVGYIVWLWVGGRGVGGWVPSHVVDFGSSTSSVSAASLGVCLCKIALLLFLKLYMSNFLLKDYKINLLFYV